MAEMITGMGLQKSIRTIVSMSDEALRKAGGGPRKGVVHADIVDCER